MAPLAGVAAGALAREAADVVDALAPVDARVRLALVVLKVAQLAGKACNSKRKGATSINNYCRCELRAQKMHLLEHEETLFQQPIIGTLDQEICRNSLLRVGGSIMEVHQD